MKKHFAFLLLSLSFASPAFANWEQMDPDQFTLPAPPAPGSRYETTEVGVLMRLQNSDRTRDCRISSTQLFPTFATLFHPMTSILTLSEFRRALPLMTRVDVFSGRMSSGHKKEYFRQRPYNSYPQIKPCIMKPFKNSMSYPSGHATIGAVESCLLARKFPERALAIIAYGQYVGNVRSVVGVHYPSDVQAGQYLGLQICNALLNNASFMQELRAL